MPIYTSKFSVTDKVIIDGDTSIIGTITAVMHRHNGYVSYEVSYIHNGTAAAPIVEEFRLAAHGR